MSLLNSLKEIDTDLFFLINTRHSPVMDVIMKFISFRSVWIPVYILLLWLFQKHFGWKSAVVLLVSAGIMIALTDLGSVHLFKNVFERYRPGHNENIKHLVHVVDNYRGAQFGFISSHAANFFGLAMLLFLAFGKAIGKYRYFFFLGAALVCYSRIYLGMHYPSDVIVGGLFGMLIGGISFLIYKFLNMRINKSEA